MKVFALAGALCLGILTAAGSIVTLARQQPYPNRLALLRLDECAPPCWLGIFPGRTSLDEASARVMEAFSEGYTVSARQRAPGSTRTLDIIIDIQSKDDPRFRVRVTLDSFDGRNDRTVRAIVFDLERANLEEFSLTGMVGYLGKPTGVRIRYGSEVLLRYEVDTYRGMMLVSRAVDGRIDGTQPAQMQFYAGGRFVYSTFRSNVPWRGFAAFHRYTPTPTATPTPRPSR